MKTNPASGQRVVYYNRTVSTQRMVESRTTLAQVPVRPAIGQPQQIVVRSVAELDLAADIRIGAEIRTPTAINRITNTITLAGTPLSGTYNTTTVVSQTLDSTEPYATRPVAPWAGESVFPVNQISAVRVKRVTAMTRLEPHTDALDGSSLECQFFDGAVKRHGAVAPATPNWTANDVDQGTNGPDSVGLSAADENTTGYDSLPNMTINANHMDARWRSSNTAVQNRTSASKTIVEFPRLVINGVINNTEARRNTAASRGALESGVSRYQRETVRINLRRVTRPIGNVSSQAAR